ncbi:hypothetical protein MKX01_005029 [Papaver californicum]|nr:hypothetical protein MKX01_005029 [Papaver californicum]
MSETNSEEAVQIQQTHTPLLSGLPDDIALFCLARVPRRYHTLLKCVSKGWRDLVCSKGWVSYRRKHNLAESWIYVLCRDKADRLERACLFVLDPISLKRCWKLVPSLPDHCWEVKCAYWGAVGCGWFEDATDEVYCYDASRNTWDTAAPLSTAGCYFACEALNEKLHAIGGVGSNLKSFVLDGKIYIRCGVSSTMPSNVYAVVYKPSSGTWEHADKDLVSGWSGPAIVVEGNLNVLDQSSGTRLMMWEKRSREWIAVGRLSPLLTRPPCRLAAIGKSIFVIGKGPSTVVFDVSRAGNVEGLMVSSSIPRLAGDDDVICCKVLSI